MIQNEFWNIVQFVPASTDKGFYKNDYQLGILEAKSNDYWRFLMPKSNLQWQPVGKFDIRLAKYEWLETVGGKIVINYPSEPIIVGTVREQNCKDYTEIKLLISKVPDGTTYKQFNIVRENGQNIFTTFKGQYTDKTEYIRALKKHFENFWATNVFVDVDGNILTIRAYVNGNFYLTNEECTIGLGTSTEQNDNNPSIDITDLGTVTIPAKYEYDLLVDNIAIGNTLTLGDRSIIVKLGDTESSVKTYLLNGAEKFIVNQSDSFSFSSSLGTYEIQNITKPNVIASFVNRVSSIDHYLIAITGEILEGNIIQVTTPSKTPITITVSATDTIATLTALLNPDSGQFNVPANDIVTINVLEGVKVVNNTNELKFEFASQISIASTSVKRYRLYINDDIVLRNKFNVNGVEYIAKSGDTPKSVANGLGFADRNFIVDIPTSKTMEAYAIKGNKYGEENISDIRILKQPKVQESSQVVCDVNIPNIRGNYIMVLWNDTEQEVVACSNQLKIGNGYDTIMLEYASIGENYNHEYYEKGLSQIVRVPMSLTMPKREVEENRTLKIEGGFVRNETNVLEFVNFTTKGINTQIMRGLQIALRNQFVMIDNQEYYSDGGITDNLIIDYADIGQCSGKLYKQGKLSNIAKTLKTNNLSSKYCEIVCDFTKVSLRILVEGENFDMLLRERAIVKSGEYNTIIDNSGENVSLDIYEDDLLKRRLLIYANTRVRLNKYVRYNDSVKFRISNEITDVEVTEWTQEEPQPIQTSIDYVPEIVVQEFNEFSKEFSEEFN